MYNRCQKYLGPIDLKDDLNCILLGIIYSISYPPSPLNQCWEEFTTADIMHMKAETTLHNAWINIKRGREGEGTKDQSSWQEINQIKRNTVIAPSILAMIADFPLEQAHIKNI